jgi:hypothetical protein
MPPAVLGGAALGLAGAVGPDEFATFYSLWLSMFQLVGFAAYGLLRGVAGPVRLAR